MWFMSTKIIEGQMDFFGLINEYTDETGATVRIKNLDKPEKPAKSENVTKAKRNPEPEKVSKEEPVMEQLTLDFSDIEVDYNKLKVDLFVEDLDAEYEKEKNSKPDKGHAEKTKSVTVSKCVEKTQSEGAFEHIEKHQNEEAPECAKRVELYKGCKRCWCADCKHNEKLEGVPRDFGGMTMACTPCADCEKESSANICPIGDYKEGCKLRAKEEGLYKEDSIEE